MSKYTLAEFIDRTKNRDRGESIQMDFKGEGFVVVQPFEGPEKGSNA